jgi:broad specificity phosphatase PhoE
VGAVASARDAARGHAAVCVSHQLPIWVLRLHLEGRSYLHDPRRRECGLASVTSLTYEGDRLTGITYAEPAGATDPDAVPGA